MPIVRQSCAVIVVVLSALVAVTPSAGAARLQPSDITYLGAFRLPPASGDAPAIWDWSGEAMAYSPEGDAAGSGDGFPGTLFATGLATENLVAQISIPAPSLQRNVEGLPQAEMIQDFEDVRQGLFTGFTEMPRVGLEYLPVQSGQSSGKLYLAWGQHHHDPYTENTRPTHAWCDTDLENPDTRGAWWVGSEAAAQEGFIYSVNGYLFAIDQGWADANVGGRRLATGRYRDGGWSGMGPSLIAIGPWLDGSPPPADAELSARTLLLYAYVQTDPGGPRLDGYSHADEWKGGAWITAGGASAVVFVGTKGSGYTWYGYSTPDGVPSPPLFGEGAPCVNRDDGVMCSQPDGFTPCTEQEMQLCEGANIEPESKGWWSSRFDAQIIFYDPDDLAAVAAATLQPYEPQPYATLDIDEHLFLNATAVDITMFHGSGNQRLWRVGETAYDRDRNLLYVLEPFANDAEPVVHVFRVAAGAGPSTRRLTVTVGGSGSGTVTSSPAGINCGSDCSHDYAAGTSVTLTARAASGSSFTGWSGACSGSGSCTVTMSANRSVAADFSDSTATLDHAYVVPVVAHSPGVGGSEWRSNVVCLNGSGTDAALELRLLTSSETRTRQATVAAGATVEWADIAVSLFGVSPSSSTAGTLHVAASTPLRLTSRTYNQGSEGTYGQYLPALEVSDTLRQSERGYLINLKGGTGFRSNVGFVNLGGGTCTVELVLYSAGGAAQGNPRQVTVPSGRLTQLNDVFAATGAGPLSLAYAVIEVVSGSGAIWAFASVVDNTTSDPTTIPVQRQ